MGIVCKFTNDTRRLLLEHFDVIQGSPSQIYHFALPFCPPSSWIQGHYGARLSHKIRVIKGLSSNWGSCFHTISLSYPIALAYSKNIIAVGCVYPDIITLDAITGSQMAVLSGHTSYVRSVTFSSDGRSLASGSDDKTIKLWDVQTGGVIKTFHGHGHYVYSVSISGDHTRIVSGSVDGTICSWDIQTGECLHTIQQQDWVKYICFSPTDPHHILSISGEKVWEWDINCQQISSLYDATSMAFSPNQSHLALCCGEVVIVWDVGSGTIIAHSNITNMVTHSCCFSPDGKLLAAAAGSTAYVWDTTSLDFHLVEVFVGHIGDINTLVFSSPSFLISVSCDHTVKIWQIGTSSENQTVTDSEHSSAIQSVSLQTTAGVAISSDRAGVVKTWDLSTGLCKTSLKSPASGQAWRDAQLIGSRLIIVWSEDGKMHIWDANKNELLQVVDVSQIGLRSLRISGDGSKVFCLSEKSIQAWSIDTGKHMGEMELELGQKWYLEPSRQMAHESGFDLRTCLLRDGILAFQGLPLSYYPLGQQGGLTWTLLVVLTGRLKVHVGSRIQLVEKKFFNCLEDMPGLLKYSGMASIWLLVIIPERYWL